MAIRTGWIIEIVGGVHLKEGLFYSRHAGAIYSTNDIRRADVKNTRRAARVLKYETERVRKVELDENGRAVKIIPGR